MKASKDIMLVPPAKMKTRGRESTYNVILNYTHYTSYRRKQRRKFLQNQSTLKVSEKKLVHCTSPQVQFSSMRKIAVHRKHWLTCVSVPSMHPSVQRSLLGPSESHRTKWDLPYTNSTSNLMRAIRSVWTNAIQRFHSSDPDR